MIMICLRFSNVPESAFISALLPLQNSKDYVDEECLGAYIHVQKSAGNPKYQRFIWCKIITLKHARDLRECTLKLEFFILFLFFSIILRSKTVLATFKMICSLLLYNSATFSCVAKWHPNYSNLIIHYLALHLKNPKDTAPGNKLAGL